MRYFVVLLLLVGCSLWGMEIEQLQLDLYEALKKGDNVGLIRLAESIDINEPLTRSHKHSFENRPIHLVVKFALSTTAETISTLVKLGACINKTKTIKRDRHAYNCTRETALDTVMRMYEKQRVSKELAKEILTTLYLYGARSSSTTPDQVKKTKLKLLKEIFLDTQDVIDTTDIRIIALLGSFKLFKSECERRAITRANAHQALDAPSPQGWAPYHSCLYLAALKAPPQTVQFLINGLGLSVNGRSPLNGLSPIYGAALNKESAPTKMIQLLLRHGAHIGIQTKTRDYTTIKSKAHDKQREYLDFRIEAKGFPSFTISHILNSKIIRLTF